MTNICDVPKTDYLYVGNFFSCIFGSIDSNFKLLPNSTSYILFEELKSKGFNPRLISNTYGLSSLSITWEDNQDSPKDSLDRKKMEEKIRQLHNMSN